MSDVTIGLIGVVVVLLLMFSRMWVGFGMILIGVLGCGILGGWKSAFSLTGTIPYANIADYTMACIPLFIFMGCALLHTGFGADLYSCARAWLGRIRGGLAMATSVACGLFAAVCGDSVATAVTMGKISYPEMIRYRYSDKMSAACIAAGGTVGVMIPPSIPFILYGLLTENSIGKLFIAGVIPGVTQVLSYCIVVFLWCRINPKVALDRPESLTIRKKLNMTRTVWPVVLVFIFMMGGLYGGLFTPPEAGAFSSFCVVAIALLMRRYTVKSFVESVKDGIKTTCMTMFIILGAYYFMRFMSLSGLPSYLSDLIATLQVTYNVPPIIIIIVIIFFYLITGCFLDMLAAILLTLPIIYPVIIVLGYDPIWWGVLMVRVMETSMITPPVGLNLFVLTKGINVPIKTLYSGVGPYIIADVCHISLLIAIPSLSTWLPSMM